MTQPPLTQTLRSFGRKQGRSPKGIRQEAIAHWLPRLEISQEIDAIEQMESLFEKPFDSYGLEIGYGAGEHLFHQATRHPDCGFIGCEPFLNGIGSLLAMIQESPVENIRIWQEDARILLEKLPNQCLDRVFILFPDPWPKIRHQKRRLVKKDLLDALARVMKPGALLRIATDHHDYANWMLAHLMPHHAFEWNASKASDWQTAPEDWVTTRYQQKALASDITTYIDCTRI